MYLQSIRAVMTDFQNPLKTLYKIAHVFFTEGEFKLEGRLRVTLNIFTKY